MFYLALKHLHSTLALLVIVLFTLRFLLRLFDAKLRHKKWLKRLAMIADIGLLVSAVAVWSAASFGLPIWVMLKLGLLVAYILFAFNCLKKARSNGRIVITGLLAFTCLCAAYVIAHSKPLLF